jgi:hypothetical protein
MVEMSRAVDGIYIRVQRWASQQEGAGTVKPGMDDVVSRPLQRKRERERKLLGWCYCWAPVSSSCEAKWEARAAGTVRTTKSVNSGDPD